MKSTFCLALAAISLSMAGPSRAGVAYSTFGPNDTLQGAGNGLYDSSSGGRYSNVANEFRLSSALSLTSIQVGVSTATVPWFTVSIFDSNDGAPGASLFSTSAMASGSFVYDYQGETEPVGHISTGPVSISIPTGLNLAADTNYWLVLNETQIADPTQSTQGPIWWTSIYGSVGVQTIAIQTSSDGVNFVPCQYCSGGSEIGDWYENSGPNQGYAFALTGTPSRVLEPSSGWLFLAGIGGLLGIPKFRRIKP